MQIRRSTVGRFFTGQKEEDGEHKRSISGNKYRSCAFVERLWNIWCCSTNCNVAPADRDTGPANTNAIGVIVTPVAYGGVCLTVLPAETMNLRLIDTQGILWNTGIEIQGEICAGSNGITLVSRVRLRRTAAPTDRGADTRRAQARPTRFRAGTSYQAGPGLPYTSHFHSNTPGACGPPAPRRSPPPASP
jgi:hypothetical protein